MSQYRNRRPSLGLHLPLVLLALTTMTACGDDDSPSDAPDAGNDVAADAAVPDVDGTTDVDAATDATAETDVTQFPIDPRFTDIANAVALDLADSNADAASIAIWLDGEIIWVGGFGALTPDGRPIDENTQFMIGSDTKKIAAIALLQAVEDGRISLEDTIAEVVPDLEMENAPEFLQASAHHLMSHQGGIMDGVEVTSDTADEDLFNFIFGEFARTYVSLVEPGRFWNYANPNFSLVGFLSQEVDADERVWAEIATEDIFVPLNMSQTVARKSDVSDNYMPGIGFAGASDTTIGPVNLDDTWESAFVRPAGLVWSTPSDQMRLAEFLVDGNDEVLSAALREAITTEQVAIYPDIPGGYGYGMFVGRGLSLGVNNYYDIPVWSHGGNTLTHSSAFYVLPEQRFAISILSNGQGDDFTRTLVAAVSSLVELPQPTTPPDVTFNPDDLDALVGTYNDPDNAGRLIISREGDSLVLDAPDLDAFGVPYESEMTRQSTRVWLMNIQEQDIDFAFIDGPNGEMYLRNRALVAVRAATDSKERLDSQPVLTASAVARLRNALRRAAFVPTLTSWWHRSH